jgi:chromosomal replication initiation ATPase DnaA
MWKRKKPKNIVSSRMSKCSFCDKEFDWMTTPAIVNVTRLQMLSKRRVKEYVEARHLAMYMAREMTTMSLPEIGREMQRDHTTVWYAAEKLSKRGRGATKLNRNIAKIKQLVA